MRWLSSLVVLALMGCAAVPPDRAPTPVEALQDCPIPTVNSKTNGGLAKGVLDLRASLRACNKDKAILRAWQEGEEAVGQN
jgi:hypothetical protein